MIELLVVISALIILAALALFAAQQARTRAYNTQAMVCGEQIRKAQTLYYSEQQAFANSFDKLDQKMVARCALVSVVEVTASASGYTYTVAHERGNAKFTIEDDKGTTAVLAPAGTVNGAAAADTSSGGQVVAPVTPAPTSTAADPFAYVTMSFSADALGQLDSQSQPAICAIITAGGKNTTLVGRYNRSPDQVYLKLNKGVQNIAVSYFSDLTCAAMLSPANGYPMAFRPQGAAAITYLDPNNPSYSTFTVNVNQDKTVTLENNANRWAIATRWINEDGTAATTDPTTGGPFFTVNYSDHGYPQTTNFSAGSTNRYTVYPGQVYSQDYIEVAGGMAGQYIHPVTGTGMYVWDDPSPVPGNFNYTSLYYGKNRADPVWGTYSTVVRVAPQNKPYVRVNNPGMGRVVDVPVTFQVYGLNLRTYLKPKPGTRPMGLTSWSTNVLSPVTPYTNVNSGYFNYRNTVDAQGNPMSAMTSAQLINVTANPTSPIYVNPSVRYVLESAAPVTLTVTGPQIQERTFEYRREQLISGNWVETP